MSQQLDRQTASLHLTSDGPRHLELRLRVIEGPDLGRELKLAAGTALVGTDEGAGLRLSDPTVSRRHAAVELLGRSARLLDLGSKNGTRYLGARVERAELPIGSVFRVGSTRIALLPEELAPDALSERSELCGLVGHSLAMRRLFAQLERVGPTEAAVLIEGESGTGKERIARALHALSERSAGPFELLDCAATAPALFHSAVFGHLKGAFTGATRDTPGALTRAHGGTLFLDEIGELPLELQASLLRALETGDYLPLGATRRRRADCRIVAATHRDLRADIRAGRFREDLYFRLSAISLRAPPLRERLDDLSALIDGFLKELGKSTPLPPETVAHLSGWHWPGNVRELRNQVLRVTALGSTTSEDGAKTGPDRLPELREKVIRAFERRYLEALLHRHRGSMSAVAREAGVARSYVYRLVSELGIDTGTGRS